MVSCSVYKDVGSGGRGEEVLSNGVCLPKSLLHMLDHCFPGDEHLPAHGECWMNSICLCFLLLSPLNCLNLNPWIFSLFQFGPPIPQVEQWMSGCVVLTSWLMLSHNHLIVQNPIHYSWRLFVCFGRAYTSEFPLDFLQQYQQGWTVTQWNQWAGKLNFLPCIILWKRVFWVGLICGL